MNTDKHERRALSVWDAKMEPKLPGFTPHAVARQCAEQGWTWNGHRYATRADWENSVLRYHGAFTLDKRL